MTEGERNIYNQATNLVQYLQIKNAIEENLTLYRIDYKDEKHKVVQVSAKEYFGQATVNQMGL